MEKMIEKKNSKTVIRGKYSCVQEILEESIESFFYTQVIYNIDCSNDV